MKPVVITPPAVEPLDANTVKAYGRIEYSDDDQLIALWISTARQLCEQATGRSLITRVLQVYLPGWPSGWLDLPQCPVSQIGSIEYQNTAGTWLGLASTEWQLDPYSVPARVRTRPSAVLPTLPTDRPTPVRITYSAGYGAAATSVPECLRNWMLAQIEVMSQNRSALDDGTPRRVLPHIDRLLDSERIIPL